YYEVLGLSRAASKDEIRASYRKLARQYHPDVSHEPDAEARFKEINEAYQVLSDDEKRSIYDRYGHAGLERQGMGPGFEGFGFGGIEDIFEDFFGFGTRRAARPGPRRGADLRYDLEISFEEAVFGCEQEIHIGRMEVCPQCGGSGAEPGTSPIRCPECNGTGQVRRAQQSIFGSFVNVTPCARCGGSGEIVTTPCTRCHGAQRVEQLRSIVVNIPAGVDDGMRVRLAGEGESGERGGPPGNLYVVVHVKPHAYFRRREDDILVSINVNIAQASLGDEITVPTLEGEHTLTMPAGTQAGTTFRIKGQGVPRLRGSGRGDQIVIVNVQVPVKLTEEQRELLTALGETMGNEISPQSSRGFLERLREVFGL
ncbi:MAG: molecular chaperone DnaJ, partial [Anaerolineae bacterium]|nr:molecular chaperone DnaJ [Anaerolineae bacterium]